MTFNFESLCALVQSGAAPGAAPGACGAEGALTLLAVLEGQCLASGLPAAKGAVVAAAGPLTVAPVGACSAVYACLSGEAARLFAAGLSGPAALPAGMCPGVPEAVHRLAEAPLPAHEASALGYGILCRLAAARAGEEPRVPPLVAAALNALQAHYAEVYGVDELAGQLGVSKSHLIRIFTASVGVSPGRYLTQVRIENARRLLAGTTLPLEVVASLCGFSGGNYLCKAFKKATGLSPGAWRQMAAPVPDSPANTWEEQLYL